MSADVFIAVVDAFMYVVLSMAKKKHMLNGGISWHHKIFNVIS